MHSKFFSLFLVMIFFAGMVFNADAAKGKKAAAKAAAANTPAAAAAEKPAEKPVAFKDVPMNAEFYYSFDQATKRSPQTKISEYAARPAATPTTPTPAAVAVAPQTMVYLKH